jgi:protein-disulfide isomerase
MRSSAEQRRKLTIGMNSSVIGTKRRATDNTTMWRMPGPFRLLVGCIICLMLTGRVLAQTDKLAQTDNMQLGDTQAPVLVIEYEAITCPFCIQWQQNTYMDFKKRFIDTGRVRYELREALTEHDTLLGAQGFLIARCAGPAAYFDVVHELMITFYDFYGAQNWLDWGAQGGAVGGLSRDQVAACARNADNLTAFSTRLTANGNATDIDSKIIGIPMFFINGHIYTGDRFNLDSFDQAISSAAK